MNISEHAIIILNAQNVRYITNACLVMSLPLTIMGKSKQTTCLPISLFLALEVKKWLELSPSLTLLLFVLFSFSLFCYPLININMSIIFAFSRASRQCVTVMKCYDDKD
jgi:hypothetical protein